VGTDGPAQRLRLALEMFEFGVRMHWTSLRRNNPDLDDVQIADLLREWMLARPGAADGDCAGPVSRRAV
jgi:hypothetical protein